MARSFHWSGAAAEYEQLYVRLVGRAAMQLVASPAPPRRRARLANQALRVAA